MIQQTYKTQRPTTAISRISQVSGKDSMNLGSVCPVILKHDFPNESKEYINDVFQEQSSTQKRFKYGRPLTAKNALTNKLQNKSHLLSSNNLENKRPQTAAVASQSSLQQMNSGELYKKLLANKGNSDPADSRFKIKPLKKLNTLQIHNALYKVKKQKEQLDFQIQELEEQKTNFNQQDFYLIANSGAMEYIFNNNSKTNNNFNMQQQSSVSEQQITQNLERKMSQSKLEMSRSNIYSRPQTAKAKSKKPEYLRVDSYENFENIGPDGISLVPPPDFDIIGNAQKRFKLNERANLPNWGEQDKEKINNKISDISKNYNNIQYLMEEKKIIDEQEEQENQEQNYMQIKEEEREEEIQYQQQKLQEEFNQQQSKLQQQHLTSDIQKCNQLGRKSSQQQSQNASQMGFINSGNGLRPQSASISGGGSFRTGTNSRPQTAKNNPLHAVMSYGKVGQAKQKIVRNFDHLELIRKKKEFEQQKIQAKLKNKQFKRQQNSLSIIGQGLEVYGDGQRNQIINNPMQIQRAAINNNYDQNYKNNMPHNESLPQMNKMSSSLQQQQQQQLFYLQQQQQQQQQMLYQQQQLQEQQYIYQLQQQQIQQQQEENQQKLN